MTSETRTPAQQCRCGHFDYNHWLSGKGSCAVPECDCNGFYTAQAIDAAIEPPEAPPDLSAASVAALAEMMAELDKESTRRHYEWLDATRELSDRLAALESPAAAPEPIDDPVCSRPFCGHPKSEHGGGDANCYHMEMPTMSCVLKCACERYVPAEPPAAALDAAPTIDPVLVAIQRAYVLMDWPKNTLACLELARAFSLQRGTYGVREFASRDEMLAYGRDGAR